MNNIDYWKKRTEQKLNTQYKKADSLEQELKEQYEIALEEINKKISNFYLKFASDNEMSYAEATQYLNGKEFNRWRKSINAYIKEIEATGNEQLLLELNTLAMKSRISRLDSLVTDVQVELSKLYSKENEQTTTLLKSVLDDTYYQTIYEVQVGRGIGHAFGKLDNKTVEDILNHPWSGENYSSRIWDQKDKLVKTIKQELTQKFIQGKDVKTTATAVSQKMNVSYRNACTLVQTETSYIAGQATARGYEETGVQKYQILATLDTHTSTICREEDGKVYDLKDKTIGVNYPPFHIRCRTTTIPYFYDEKGERAARDPDNGKTYYVPSDMKYDDWYNKYVENNGINDIIKEKDFQYPEIKTIKEAENWALTNLNLKSVSYKDISLDVANYVNNSIHEIYSEYPLLNGFVQEIKTDGRIKATASASLGFKDGKLNTKLNLSKNDLSNLKSIDEMIDKCVEARWWTPKDGVKGIIKHEMGHMIEYAMNLRRYGVINEAKELDSLNKLNECFNAIKKGEISKDIKIKALSNLKVLNTKKNIKENLSDYSNHSTLEFLAEAVSEEKPRSLAKEVVRLLKEKIKEVWK